MRSPMRLPVAVGAAMRPDFRASVPPCEPLNNASPATLIGLDGPDGPRDTGRPVLTLSAPSRRKPMNKLLPLFGALLIATLLTDRAQAQAFEPGNNVAGLLLGIGGHYSAYGSYSSMSPALGLFYERASNADVGPGVLGLGGLIAYKSLHSDDRYYWPGYGYYNYDFRWTYLILGFRGAYHWNAWHKVPELDTYGGLMLSYNLVTFHDNTDYPNGYPDEYDYSSSSGMGLSLYLGSRYYFSDAFGVSAELGYGIAVLNIGCQFKF